MNYTEPASVRFKCGLLLAACAATILAAAIPHPGRLRWVLWFPLGAAMGLERFGISIPGFDNGFPKDYMAMGAGMVGGWLLYFGLAGAGLLARRRVTYFAVYLLIWLLLALNIVGCHCFEYPLQIGQ